MSDYQTVEVPITVTLAAYTANDVVGGLLTSDAIKQIQGRSYIQWVRLIDGATQAEPFLLYVFTAVPSTIADSAAFAPLEADWAKCAGSISIPAANYDTFGSEADCAWAAGKDRKTNEFITFGNSLTGKLYFYLVAVETPDYAAVTDLTLHLNIMTE